MMTNRLICFERCTQLLQNFEMVFTEPVEQVYKFLISPKGPVKVIFKERSSLNT